MRPRVRGGGSSLRPARSSPLSRGLRDLSAGLVACSVWPSRRASARRMAAVPFFCSGLLREIASPRDLPRRSAASSAPVLRPPRRLRHSRPRCHLESGTLGGLFDGDREMENEERDARRAWARAWGRVRCCGLPDEAGSAERHGHEARGETTCRGVMRSVLGTAVMFIDGARRSGPPLQRAPTRNREVPRCTGRRRMFAARTKGPLPRRVRMSV